MIPCDSPCFQTEGTAKWQAAQYPRLMETLADRLKGLMRRRGLSPADLVKAGIDSGALSKWMGGKQEPGADSLRKLSSVLGISAHWLLTGEEPIELPGRAGADAEWIRREAIAQDLRRRLYAAIDAVLAMESPEERRRIAERAIADVEAADQGKPARAQRPKRGRRAAGGSR